MVEPTPNPDLREKVARIIALHGHGTVRASGNREPPNSSWTQAEWERRVLHCIPLAVELQCNELADAIHALYAETIRALEAERDGNARRIEECYPLVEELAETFLDAESRANALLSKVEMAEGVLNWLAAHPELELSYGYSEPEDWEDDWRVHSVHGGRNDREWTLIGRGPTPLAAIQAARDTLAAIGEVGSLRATRFAPVGGIGTVETSPPTGCDLEGEG
jgi:hypothetical protein